MTISNYFQGDSGGALACEGTSNIEEDKNLGILVGVYVAYLTDKSCLYVRVSTFAKFIDSPDPKTLRSKLSDTNNALNKARVVVTFPLLHLFIILLNNVLTLGLLLFFFC